MSRFLFVTPPIAERVRPAMVVGRELSTRGHDVAWVTQHSGFDGSPPAVAGLGGPVAQLQLWDDHLLPLARAMAPAVRTAIEDLDPHVVVADHQALAGAAVAEAAGVPWVTVVPTSAGLVDPLWDLPAIRRRIRRRTRRFLHEVGLDDIAAARLDPRASPHLVIACTTEALAGPIDDPTGRHVFVGPGVDTPPEGSLRSRGWIDPGRRQLVVVSLQTPPEDRRARLHRAVVEALSSLEVRAVLLGPVPPGTALPDNVTVAPTAALPRLAGQASAVVCDGAHDTVCTALARATPLVVLPLAGEQPIIARQIVRATAGVRVPARQQDPVRLRRAIATVLTDPRVHHAARRIRHSFASAHPTTAATRLEHLLTTGPTTTSLRPHPAGAAS